MAGEIARGAFTALSRQILGGVIVGSIFSLILGYAVGTVSAVGVGIIVAVRDCRVRGVSLRTVVLAALGLWLASAAVVLLAVPLEGRLAWIGALLAAHLLGGLACSWMARRIFGGRAEAPWGTRRGMTGFVICPPVCASIVLSREDERHGQSGPDLS